MLSVCGPPATRKMGLLYLVTASSAAAAERCVWSHTSWWKAAEEEEEHGLKTYWFLQTVNCTDPDRSQELFTGSDYKPQSRGNR